MLRESKGSINKILVIICLISLVITIVSLFLLFHPGVNIQSLPTPNPGPSYNFYTSGQGNLKWLIPNFRSS